jgi:hypothetical protein
MAEKKRDVEIEALEAVHAALKPLTPDQRAKVLASVFALLGIQREGLAGTDTPAASVARPPASSPTPELQPRPSGRPLSLNELLRGKPPGTSAQRITLFAYYRDKHEGIQRFGRNELRAYFAKAKEQPPRNYDRDFVEAVKRGWIHEDGDDSYITSKGIEIVESGFAGERKYTKGGKARRKSARSSPAKASRTKRQRKTSVAH